MTCCIFLEKLKTTPIMVLTNNTTDWEVCDIAKPSG